MKKQMVFVAALMALLPVRDSVAKEAQRAQKSQRNATELIRIQDDFRTDSRAKYRIEGHVQWQPGKLVLKNGASWTKETSTDNRAEVTLNLAFPKLTAHDHHTETRIGILVNGTGLVEVRITRRLQAGQTTAQVSIWQTPERSEGLGGVLDDLIGRRSKRIRTYTVEDGALQGPLTLAYRYGLLTVKSTSKAVAIGYADGHFASAVNGWRVAQRIGGDLTVSNVVTTLTKSQDAGFLSLVGRMVYAKTAMRYGSESVELAAQRKFDEALPLANKYLIYARKAFGERHLNYAFVLNYLAGLHALMGNYGMAELVLEKAAPAFSNVLGDDHPEYADLLSNLVSLYEAGRDFPKSLSAARKVLEIRRLSLGERHEDFLPALWTVARIHTSLGELERSEALYKEAVRITTNVVDDPIYHVMALHNLGTHYLGRNDFVKGEALVRKALETAENSSRVPRRYALVCALSLAECSRDGKSRAARERLYDDCMKAWKTLTSRRVPRDNDADLLTTIASLYVADEENEKAERLQRRAFRLLKEANEVVLPSLSEAQAIAWIRSRRPCAEEVLPTARRLGRTGRDVYPFVWESKGLATRLSGGGLVRADGSSEAQDIIQKLRQVRSQMSGMLQAMPDNAALHGFVRKRLTELTKAKERLENELAATSKGAAVDLAIRDATIGDLLDWLPREVAVIDFVELPHRKWTESQIGGRTFRKRITERHYEAFVLSRGDDGGHVVWVDIGAAEPINKAVDDLRRKIQRHVLVARSQDRNDSDRGRFRPASEGNRSNEKSPEATLRRLIWDKVEPHLKGRKTVVVLPDSRLTALPWGALQGRKENSFLIEEYAIGTASFGQQVYGLLRRPVVDGRALLVAGGIDYDQQPEELSTATKNTRTDGFSPLGKKFRAPVARGKDERRWTSLKRTRDEVAGIAKLHRVTWGAKSWSFSGRRASETKVAQTMAHARYVHLATHGFFSQVGSKGIFHTDPRRLSAFESDSASKLPGGTVGGRNPLLMCGVLLSGANRRSHLDELGLPSGNEGILTAEEVLNLDLRNTELVVLSACETNLGDVANGEGVFGLQRAFGKAGARTVIASLWKVNDAATQALMMEFYGNLWKRKLGRLEALRQAKLTMIKRYDPRTAELRGPFRRPEIKKVNTGKGKLAPFFWAAFVLNGDWR